jgi:cell fate regulator YaaT (PSP1 superfamily)
MVVEEGLVAGVRFQPKGRIYHFDATGHVDLQSGDFVLVETARGQQLGEIVGVQPACEVAHDDDLKPIKRRATGRDMALRLQLREKEAHALEKAREIGDRLRIPLKFVTAEYTFDAQRLTFLYFSEEKHLDLGSLISRLQRTFEAYVDVRRIGPRDQAKLLGGYGACGEPRCCSRFLTDFRPVSIKMAKTQGVSLNPSEITGMCGRLRCCLLYEQEQYAEATKRLPRRKKRVQTPHGEGRVIDLLPLRDLVVVQVGDRRVEVPVEDVEVL